MNEELGSITLPVTVNDDATLTCLYCWRENCEWSVMLKGDGRTIVSGLHERCALRQLKRKQP